MVLIAKLKECMLCARHLSIFIEFILTITLSSRYYYYQPHLIYGNTESLRVSSEWQKCNVNSV